MLAGTFKVPGHIHVVSQQIVRPVQCNRIFSGIKPGLLSVLFSVPRQMVKPAIVRPVIAKP